MGNRLVKLENAIAVSERIQREGFALKIHTENQQVVARAGNLILQQVLANYHGPVAIRLWDGKLAVGHADAPCTVTFTQPSVLRELVLHRDVVHLAENYCQNCTFIQQGLAFESPLPESACASVFPV